MCESNFKLSEVQDCLIVSIYGDFDITIINDFEQQVVQKIRQYECCILDFSECSYISSMGVRQIIELTDIVTVALVAPTENQVATVIVKAMQLNRYSSVFDALNSAIGGLCR